MQYQYINQQTALNEFVASISRAKVIAIDTEFMRRRTLYPEVALIQVFDGEKLGLIDPLEELDLTPLWDVFANPAILKVIHSPSEDIEVFLRTAGQIPTPLFDTQFALQILEQGNCVGFANMVKLLLDKEIDKSESRTNWLARPLTQAQLDYAAADVHYLLPCFEKIEAMLAGDEKKFGIILGEAEEIARKRAYRAPYEVLYRDVKNAWQLNPEQLNVLRILAKWRQQRAEQKNLALSFIVKDHALVNIAMRKPKSVTQLRNVPEVEPFVANKLAKPILNAVAEAESQPPSHYPEKLKRLIDFPAYKRLFKEVKGLCQDAARAHGIPLDVLASKKQMNQFISYHLKYSPAQRAQRPLPDVLCGWRATILAPVLTDWQITE